MSGEDLSYLGLGEDGLTDSEHTVALGRRAYSWVTAQCKCTDGPSWSLGLVCRMRRSLAALPSLRAMVLRHLWTSGHPEDLLAELYSPRIPDTVGLGWSKTQGYIKLQSRDHALRPLRTHFAPCQPTPRPRESEPLGVGHRHQ